MKHQYVGDINDYRKYALLRVLSAGGAIRIGVCWMLTPSDGSSDGEKRRYLEQPERYRRFDPELFDELSLVSPEPDRRRLESIEQSGIVPGATYFNAVLTDAADERMRFMADCRRELANADLVFFDPDNGLETTLHRGRKGSSKFLYLDEAAAFYAAGKSLLIYQHFPREKREAFIASCAARLYAVAPAATLCAFRTAHVVFLLLNHPESPAALTEAAQLASTKWSAKARASAKWHREDFILGSFIPSLTHNPLAALLAELDDDTAE
ncbi:hypothetical protein NVS89_17335 [Ancylobacter sp. MQZ15Z-1]|uniref:Uncharacterized protein n=1 Tax=Ancylobacter mangrovi TaxID=2972472 RepID=A0A9X2T324_9HYPH|nr:hypothetical protein [Ancylobacter mangrovi]MCS0496865.1 hypothetical protein [Ancylobacter mangrovi]